MKSIIVERESVITRPIEVVRAQFVDMQHHARTHVHPGLDISNVRPQPGGCRFTARRRVFGLWQEDEFELALHADGDSTLRSLSGANEGMRITQRFTPPPPKPGWIARGCTCRWTCRCAGPCACSRRWCAWASTRTSPRPWSRTAGIWKNAATRRRRRPPGRRRPSPMSRRRPDISRRGGKARTRAGNGA